MKRSLLIMLLGCGAVFSAVADDRPIADQDLIAEFKEFCEEMAEDDGTGSMTLPEYLLVCINDELDTEGYQPIATIPQ